MPSVDTVIFDVGRVLTGIRCGEKFNSLMRRLGVDPDDAFSRYWHTPEVRGHMTGKIGSREFYGLVRERFDLSLAFADFAEAWSDIFIPMPGMAELFAAVAARRPPGILSDTDPLHWARLRALYPWLDRAPRPTLSFEVGRLKPHPAMYAAAAADSGREAGRCLFIDDVRENVDAARACGMRAILFVDADRVRADLSALQLL